MTCGQQLGALLKKNFLLYKRNVGSTVLLVIAPVIFIALLFLMEKAVQANQSTSSSITLVRTSEIENVGSIPRCLVGVTGKCYSFGYTPQNDANVQAIATAIASQNNIPMSEVIGFDSEAEANVNLSAEPNTTQAIFHVLLDYGCDELPTSYEREVCYSANHVPADVAGIKYTIQYNDTEIAVKGRSLSWESYLLQPLMQAFDRAVFSEYGDSSLGWDMSTAAFPHPELSPTSIISTAGPFFFFAAVMINFVIQTGQIVLEKQHKLRESMRVMGMQNWTYWLTWFITCFITNVISVLMLIAAGAVFQFDFFLKNDFLTYFFLLLLFALAMVPVAFLIATLVDVSDNATLAGFGFFLVGVFLQSFATFIFAEGTDFGWQFLFSLFPFALLAKGLGDLGEDTSSELSTGLRWADVANADAHFFPLSEVYVLLIMNFFLYLVLAWYVDAVRYLDLPLYFFLTPSYYGLGSPPKVKNAADNEYSIDVKDVDIIAEKKFIAKGDFDPVDVPVVISNLQKTYRSFTLGCIPDKKGDFRAVRGVDVVMEQGRLFCLLGHNGAGKSTTIGMLTGLFPCSGGNATIFGYSIVNEMDEIRKKMGVCPQHDILFKQLTAEEHLDLFANLRGIPSSALAGEISDRLEDVDLTWAKDSAAGGYSGGMQRRLSVAIALIGDPAIVFLDEPTTGMDPVSRRKVWNLIEKVKRGRVTLLTTHSMEEADILGDKIAIMKDGRLATVGTSIRLKNRFGTGYRISILGETPGALKKIRSFVESQFPSDHGGTGKATGKKHKKKEESEEDRESSDENELEMTDMKKKGKIDTASDKIIFDEDEKKLADGVLILEVPRALGDSLPAFFKALESQKKNLNVKDFQVNLSTLEEVFMAIADEDDVDETVTKKPKTGCSKKKTCCCCCGPKIPMWKMVLAWVAGVVGVILLLIILSAVLASLAPTEADPTAPVLPLEPVGFPSGLNSPTVATFPSGVQVTEVDNDSLTITVRTTAAAVDFEFWRANGESWGSYTNTDPSFIVSSVAPVALYDSLGFVTVTLLNFPVDSTFAVVARDSASTTVYSAPSRFRTPLEWRQFSFGVGSGFGFVNAPYDSLSYAASLNLDFFVMLGDTVFAPPAANNGTLSKSEYQRLYDDQLLAQSGFRDLSASTSLYGVIGVEELGPDYDSLHRDQSPFTASIGVHFSSQDCTADASSIQLPVADGSCVDLSATGTPTSLRVGCARDGTKGYLSICGDSACGLCFTTEILANGDCTVVPEFGASVELSCDATGPAVEDSATAEPYLSASSAFKEVFGIAPTSPLYRSFTFGDKGGVGFDSYPVMELFLVDVRTESDFFDLLGTEQMEWFVDGLENSNALYKFVVSAQPFSEFLLFDSTISADVHASQNTWTSAPEQRQRLLDLFASEVNSASSASADPKAGKGYIWLSGGIGATVMSKNILAEPTNNMFELVNGPVGSSSNPLLKMRRFLSDPRNFPFSLDSWSFTEIKGDPLQKTLTITLYSDKGTPLRTIDVDVGASDLGIKDNLGSAFF